VADAVAREQGARVVVAADAPTVPLRARGAFQQRNFALARAAAESYLEQVGTGRQGGMRSSPARGEEHERAVRDAGASTAVPGRLQVIDADPLTVFDGAHNPDAVAALIESLPAVLGDRPTGVVLGVLEDKDAASMLGDLLVMCERAWFTAPPSDRALSPAALESLARQLGFEVVTCEPTPRRALAEARRWASGCAGAVLVTGSVYLVGELLGGLDQELDGGPEDARDGSIAEEPCTVSEPTALRQRLMR
jgi:dihydrofolate synthase / folylpolyglutamate synthase